VRHTGRLAERDVGGRGYRAGVVRHQAQPLPQTTSDIAATVAGQEDQLGAAIAEKATPQEARFAADVNHQISKRIVAEAERTGCGIAVEQLTGTRDRVRLRKPQRATMHSWAFAQLGSFLAYKAKQAGVAFVEVDPAYTSQTCSACGWVDKKKRRSQAVFECGRCGSVGHADHNAAINIASRGVERWGEVMRPRAAPSLTAS
jgi:putative transposase